MLVVEFWVVVLCVFGVVLCVLFLGLCVVYGVFDGCVLCVFGWCVVCCENVIWYCVGGDWFLYGDDYGWFCVW